MTNDFIEDACDTLDSSGAPYVILVGDGPLTKVFSNIGKPNLEMLERWLDDGHFEKIIRDHLNSIRK